MKERVISTLRELSDPYTQETMMQLLCDELQVNKEEISIRAQNLLNAVLHNYTEFAIGTIDSFVHRIVRTFALDLKLPLNFSIETNRERVLAQCVDELAGRIGEDETITKVMVEFSRTRVEEDRNWKVDEEIFSFVKKMLNEEGVFRMEKIRSVEISSLMSARQLMQDFQQEFAGTLKLMGGQACSWIEEQGLEAADFFQSGKGIWNYFRKIAAGEISDEVINSYVTKTITEKKWKSSSSRLTDAQIARLEDTFSKIEAYRTAGKEKYFTYTALLRNIYSLMVVSEIEKIMAAVKEEENIVFISEFNRMISDVVAREPIPFVYERIGEKYRHFLLDEFQDTSELQWRNLLPLLDNSLASGNFNLVVGDGKQSIYRWRGGEVEQFVGLPSIPGTKDAILLEREDSLKRNYTGKVLERNFRSLEKVVQLNNTLYDWMKENILPEEFRRVYDDSHQLAKKDSEGGFVSFEMTEGGMTGEESDAAICKAVESYVRKNTEEYHYSFADITVLVRNKNNGKKIADHLVSKGIPIVSSESLLLAPNESVGALLSALHLVQAERSHVHEARLLRFLHNGNWFYGVTFSYVWSEFLLSGKTLGDWLFERGAADIRRTQLAVLPLFDACSRIATELKLTSQDPLFIQFFLDAVLEFSRSNRENLRAFLDWWEDNGSARSAILPSGADAVNIMTIHASKGLQFPVVILAYADWETFKPDYLWVDIDEKELPGLKTTMVNSPSQLDDTPYSATGEAEKNKQKLDNVNLLYVATTRPENHLHIIARDRKRSGYVDKWLNDFFSSAKGVIKEGNVCSFGAMTPKKEKKEKRTDYFRYGFSLRDRSDLPALRLSVSDHPEIPLFEEKREDGILFHLAMSRIFSPHDVMKTAPWLSSKGYCTAVKAGRIQDKIISLFRKDFFRALFPAHPALNEPEILGKEKSFRPDRVLFLPGETWIIDYKTGGEKPEFYEQLANYADALTQMNYPRVRKFIIYIEEERMEEVS